LAIAVHTYFYEVKKCVLYSLELNQNSRYNS
jgi:hypothetical protein